MNKEYCVAIRTLGTAGAKYKALLDSINVQTVLPKKIFVYLPYGYEEPGETIGVEHIIRCEKGMVAQRSLPFEDIDTEYVLFCDDDMYLPPQFVERILECIEKDGADCIVPDIYQPQKMSLFSRGLSTLYNSTLPRKDDGWALKIRRNVGYSYNVNPQYDFLPTETGPGGCLFCNMTAFRNIHFEEERWLDKFLFASFEDQLFLYKLRLANYNVFMYYNSGIKHLDAKATTRPNVKKRMFYKKKIQYVVWYRTIYDIENNGEKWKCKFAFGLRNVIGILALFGDIIRYRKINYLWDYFAGLRSGRLYVNSEEYRKVPKFDKFSQK